MRPAIAIFCVILTGVVLAGFLSTRTPHPDPLPDEVEAAKKAADNTPKPDNKPADTRDTETKFAQAREGAVRATIEIMEPGPNPKPRAILEMELYPKAAPKTVAHIIELAHKNFWDGLKVHREEAAVIQMGDPESKDVKPADFELKGIGSHGSGTMVPLEVDQKLPNVQYTIGLARTADPNTGDSQFYINKKDNPDFDYQYCVFGRVVKGAELLETIKKGDVIKHLEIDDAKPK